MTLAQIIDAILGGAESIEQKLETLIADNPDLKDALQPLLDGLKGAISPAQLVEAIRAIGPEGLQFLKDFKLDPRFHPSDLVG
jgi:hypothetical protein